MLCLSLFCKVKRDHGDHNPLKGQKNLKVFSMLLDILKGLSKANFILLKISFQRHIICPDRLRTSPVLNFIWISIMSESELLNCKTNQHVSQLCAAKSSGPWGPQSTKGTKELKSFFIAVTQPPSGKKWGTTGTTIVVSMVPLNFAAWSWDTAPKKSKSFCPFGLWSPWSLWILEQEAEEHN